MSPSAPSWLKEMIECDLQGRCITVPVQVQDLHAVSPSSFLEVAGGVVHGLSYQQARNNTSKVGQVSNMPATYPLGTHGPPLLDKQFLDKLIWGGCWRHVQACF